MFVIFLLAFVSGGGGICFNPDPNFGCAGLSIEAEATFHNVSSLINHISKQTSNSFIYINSTRDYSFNISFHDFGFQNEGRNTVSLIGMTHNLIKSKIAIFFDKRGNSKFLFNDISFENLDVIFQPFDEDIVLQGRSFTEKYSNFNIGFFIFDNSFHFDKFQQSENLSNNESNSKTDELFDDNLKENSSEKWYQNENNIFLNQKNSTKNDLITSDKNEHFNLHFLNQIDNCINETSHESLNLFTSKQTNDYPKNCTIVIDFNEKYKIKLLDIYYLDVSDEFLQCVKNISYQLLTMEIRVASLNHIFNKYHETGNFSGQTIQMSKNSHPDFQKDNFSEHLPKTVKKEYRHYCQYTNHSDDKKEIDPNKDNIYHSVFLLQKTVNTYNSIIVLINNGTEPVYHQCVSTRHFTLFYFGFFLEFMTANKTALEYTLYEGSSITVDSLLIENDPVVSFNIYGLGNNNVNLTGKTIDIRTIILNQGKLINNAHSSFKDITLYKDVYFYSDMNFAISGKLEIKGNVTIGTTKRYLQGFVENLLLREGEFSLLNNIFTQFELIVMYLVAGNTIDSAEPIFMLNIPLTVVYSIQNGHTSIRASELILFSKETRIEYYFDSLSSLDITLQPIFVNTIKYEVDNMVDQKTFHTLLKRNPYFLKMNQKSKSKSNLYHYNYIHSQKNNIEKKNNKNHNQIMMKRNIGEEAIENGTCEKVSIGSIGFGLRYTKSIASHMDNFIKEMMGKPMPILCAGPKSQTVNLYLFNDTISLSHDEKIEDPQSMEIREVTISKELYKCYDAYFINYPKSEEVNVCNVSLYHYYPYCSNKAILIDPTSLEEDWTARLGNKTEKLEIHYVKFNDDVVSQDFSNLSISFPFALYLRRSEPGEVTIYLKEDQIKAFDSIFLENVTLKIKFISKIPKKIFLSKLNLTHSHIENSLDLFEEISFLLLSPDVISYNRDLIQISKNLMFSSLDFYSVVEFMENGWKFSYAENITNNSMNSIATLFIESPLHINPDLFSIKAIFVNPNSKVHIYKKGNDNSLEKLIFVNNVGEFYLHDTFPFSIFHIDANSTYITLRSNINLLPIALKEIESGISYTLNIGPFESFTLHNVSQNNLINGDVLNERRSVKMNFIIGASNDGNFTLSDNAQLSIFVEPESSLTINSNMKLSGGRIVAMNNSKVMIHAAEVHQRSLYITEAENIVFIGAIMLLPGASLHISGDSFTNETQLAYSVSLDNYPAKVAGNSIQTLPKSITIANKDNTDIDTLSKYKWIISEDWPLFCVQSSYSEKDLEKIQINNLKAIIQDKKTKLRVETQISLDKSGRCIVLKRTHIKGLSSGSIASLTIGVMFLIAFVCVIAVFRFFVKY